VDLESAAQPRPFGCTDLGDPMKLPNRRHFCVWPRAHCAIRCMSRWRGRKATRRGQYAFCPIRSRHVPGHHRSPVSSMGIGAAPPIHHHENRPGAAALIGTEAAVRAISGRIHSSLYSYGERYQRTLVKNLNFDFLRDIVPIAGIVRLPNLVHVSSINSSRDASSVNCLCQGQLRKLNLARRPQARLTPAAEFKS